MIQNERNLCKPFELLKISVIRLVVVVVGIPAGTKLP